MKDLPIAIGIGNARVTFADLNDDAMVDETEILQTNHYYPFGMRHEGNTVPQQGIANAYQYNGKELVDALDLGWYDYGARWYDAAIARWNTIDPLAETTASWSSYNYCLNNPIRYTDPSGMSATEEEDKKTSSTETGASTNSDGAKKTDKSTGSTEDKTSTNDEDNTTAEVTVTATGKSSQESKPIKPLDNKVSPPSKPLPSSSEPSTQKHIDKIMLAYVKAVQQFAVDNAVSTVYGAGLGDNPYHRSYEPHTVSIVVEAPYSMDGNGSFTEGGIKVKTNSVTYYKGLDIYLNTIRQVEFLGYDADKYGNYGYKVAFRAGNKPHSLTINGKIYKDLGNRLIGYFMLDKENYDALFKIYANAFNKEIDKTIEAKKGSTSKANIKWLESQKL